MSGVAQSYSGSQGQAQASYQSGGARGDEHGFDSADIAKLLQAGGDSPAIMAYIRARLSGQALPALDYGGNYARAKQAAAFNPPAAMPGNRVGGTTSGQRTQGITNGTGIDLGERKQRYEQGYQDRRSAANRQTQLNQDYDQEQRMTNSRMQLLQRLLGGGGMGGGTRETREEVFNNAGGPQVVQLHRTQSADPMQLLQYLFR